MPVVKTSAFYSCEDVLNRMRAILADAAIAQGDWATDNYPGMFPALNTAFENVQKQLAAAGVETLKGFGWLIGVPAVTVTDPEARLIITDEGTSLIYPNGVGDVYYDLAILGYAPPIVPDDLVVPFKLWERQNGTANFTSEMRNSNAGLIPLTQQLLLIDWQWTTYQSSDALMFRGALQVQDVKLEYERQLLQVAAPTDPLPIRGVGNAVAYELAKILSAPRGGTIAASLAQEGQAEIEVLKNIAARRQQRKKSRRVPYSGRGRRPGFSLY